MTCTGCDKTTWLFKVPATHEKRNHCRGSSTEQHSRGKHPHLPLLGGENNQLMNDAAKPLVHEDLWQKNEQPRQEKWQTAAPCWHFNKGHCKFGARCRSKHEHAATEAARLEVAEATRLQQPRLDAASTTAGSGKGGMAANQTVALELQPLRGN